MRPLRVCLEPGCTTLTRATRCDPHAQATRRAQQRRTDAARPNARQRGYNADHDRYFRRPVLTRDPICVICHQAPSEHADHWPHTRQQLTTMGENPNDPRWGRGLCQPCHARHTATHDGGYGNPTTPHHAQ